MKSIRITAFLISIFCCAGAEAQYLYFAPISHYNSTFKQKADLYAGLGISRSNELGGMEFYFARAMGKQWLLSGSFLNAGSQEIRRKAEEGSQFRFGDLALGLYEKHERGTISVLLGANYGDLYNTYELQKTAHFRLMRYYLQPSMMIVEKYMQYGLSLRMTRLRYLTGDVDFAIPEASVDAIRLIEEKGPFFLPEFGANAGIRLDNIVFGISLTSIFPRVNYFNFSRYNATASLTYEFRGK